MTKEAHSLTQFWGHLCHPKPCESVLQFGSCYPSLNTVGDIPGPKGWLVPTGWQKTFGWFLGPGVSEVSEVPVEQQLRRHSLQDPASTILVPQHGVLMAFLFSPLFSIASPTQKKKLAPHSLPTSTRPHLRICRMEN